MIRLYEYSIPFREPLVTGSVSISHRSGLLLRYTGPQCDTVSEIAPLPPFSGESLTEIVPAIKAAKTDLENFLREPFTPDELNLFIRSVSDSPTLRWGLSWLGATLHDSRKSPAGQPVPKPEAVRTVLINDLIGSARPDELRTKIMQSIDAGFRTLKIKCLNPDPETADIIRSAAAGHPDVTFRLDANLSWGSDSVHLFNTYYRGLPVEYIEEPFPRDRHDELNPFIAPIAKDESIRDLKSLSELLLSGEDLFAVIKPMTFGTVFDLAETILTARSMKRKIVISNLLESAVGRSFNLRFASHFGDPELAHGLNTGKFFKWDLLNEIPPDRGILFSDQRLFQPIEFNQLNAERFIEIELPHAK